IQLSNSASAVNQGTISATNCNLTMSGATTSSFTNNGTMIQTDQSIHAITISAPLTNWNGNALSGGAYVVTSTLAFPSLPTLTTLAADIRLMTTSASVTSGGSNALANV